MEAQAVERKPLEDLLLDLGFISEDDLISLMSEHLGVPVIGRKEFPQSPVPLQGVNPQFLKHAKILPLEILDGTLLCRTPRRLDRDLTWALETMETFLDRVPPVIESLFGSTR